MTRDEGWRVGLAFLAREITRRAHAPFAHITAEQFGRHVAELDSKIVT